MRLTNLNHNPTYLFWILVSFGFFFSCPVIFERTFDSAPAYNDFLNDNAICNLRSNGYKAPCKIPAEIVNEYKSKPAPAFKLQGKYIGAGVVGRYHAKITITFLGDGTIKKTIDFKRGVNSFIKSGTHLEGGAKYFFDGSVLVYKDVTGSRLLFPFPGEPVIIDDAEKIILPVADGLVLSRE